MKLVTLGDSITRGTHINDDGAWDVANSNYSKVVQTLLRIDELDCLGVNGVSISSTSSVNSDDALSRLCKQINDANVIIVAGGTNDYGTDVVIGNPQDKEDISHYGGLNVLCTYLKNNFKDAEIYFVLPIKRRNERAKNKAGFILQDYRNAIKTIAKNFGFNVIDGSQMQIDPENIDDARNYIKDGLHLNTAGHKIYGEFIYNEITKIRNKG